MEINREIIFRGKRKLDNSWIYGSLLTERFIDDEEYLCCEICLCDVHLETVGQFIGLTDKNGNKIFEGDIVVFNRTRNLPNNSVVPEVIGWHQGDCAFQRFPRGCCLTRGGAGKLIQPDMMSECEVIGNIYDDRKLLEKVL